MLNFAAPVFSTLSFLPIPNVFFGTAVPVAEAAASDYQTLRA
jgi:hypothetical protein